MCSRTPTLPKSCSSAAYSICVRSSSREPDLAVLARCSARLTALREPDRELGDALGVTGRRRIARLDRGDRGLHEAVEQRLDLLVEEDVLERDAGLRRERGDVRLGDVVERHDAVLEVARQRRAAIQPFARLLISWMTPITSSRAEIIGTASTERVW